MVVPARTVRVTVLELFGRRVTHLDHFDREVQRLTRERVARLKPEALVMHPGPMNRGVEIAVDPGELPTSVILDQVTNGIAVRMAVLFDLLGSGAESILTQGADT